MPNYRDAVRAGSPPVQRHRAEVNALAGTKLAVDVNKRT